MTLKFATDYKSILVKIDQIDPVQYGSSRNYINGAVTYLSPYISRGVISTKQVLESVLQRGYKFHEIESFVKELCWRDYFQRVGQEKDLNQEIKQQQAPVLNHEIPSAIFNATTGIESIDNGIQDLYNSGYLHNHCRMYTASLICNIAKSHWYYPAQWMYYHLLDGDWASNACSWQWVAGANSNKKYYANQENINKYTYSKQENSYLDKSYEAIETMETPASLLNTQKLRLITTLPAVSTIQLDKSLPTFIYNYYNLDPLWHQHTDGNKVLLLEPDFFTNYPVSSKCINFIMQLSKNIADIKIYVGSFESLSNQVDKETIYYKEHPLNKKYTGTEESRDWISDTVTGYYPSFFAYWKKIRKQIENKFLEI